MACDDSSSFLSGKEARIVARDMMSIHREICAIQTAILEAISNCNGAGKYETIIPSEIITSTPNPTPPPEFIEDSVFLPVTIMTSTLDSDNDGEPDSILYYKTFVDQIDNPAISDQLEYVKRHFTGLGYTIKIQVNPVTMNTIQWVIKW